nr:B3 domain-containing protein, DNA-binding pseudobarrel domain protein [Tanacetum cinerariifolium]
MAFSPYKRPPQLIDFMNLFSKDCPSTVTSSSFTNLPSEAEPEFLELSLGVKALVTTSSFIDHSRLLKRKRPSQHQELVNAAKSFTLHLSPSDSAPVTTSNLLINYSAMSISFIPPKKTAYPTSTQPIEEPHKKKRKITPKIKSGPVVKNENVFYMSDLKQDQNRLNLPLKKLETEDFLTIEEKLALENEYEIEVRLVGPTLKMYKEPMRVVNAPDVDVESSNTRRKSGARLVARNGSKELEMISRGNKSGKLKFSHGCRINKNSGKSVGNLPRISHGKSVGNQLGGKSVGNLSHNCSGGKYVRNAFSSVFSVKWKFQSSGVNAVRDVDWLIRVLCLFSDVYVV